MSRPIGSKNKITTLEELPTSLHTVVNKPIHYDLNISIRAFRDGRFKGLWELSKLKNDGKREIIVDATSRQSVVNMVIKQIMKMVIA